MRSLSTQSLGAKRKDYLALMKDLLRDRRCAPRNPNENPNKNLKQRQLNKTKQKTKQNKLLTIKFINV